MKESENSIVKQLWGNKECSIQALLVILSIHFQNTYCLRGICGFDDYQSGSL